MIDAGGALVAGRSPRSWRRVALSAALAVIALAVIGMHQLSLGHLFVTTTGSAAADHTHATSSHASPSRADMAMMTSMSSGAADSPARSAAPSVWMGSATEGGCTDCGDHVMGPVTCLLALTLLVLFWWLRLPRPRTSPPVRRRLRSRVALQRRRPRIHALSLLELSILRT